MEESASWVEVAVVASLRTQLGVAFFYSALHVLCKDCILVSLTVILVSRGSYATCVASNKCYLETVTLCTHLKSTQVQGQSLLFRMQQQNFENQQQRTIERLELEIFMHLRQVSRNYQPH